MIKRSQNITEFSIAPLGFYTTCTSFISQPKMNKAIAPQTRDEFHDNLRLFIAFFETAKYMEN